MDFLNTIDDNKKYLLSPLINYCYKIMPHDLKNKTELEIIKDKKNIDENKLYLDDIRDYLSHYYHPPYTNKQESDSYTPSYILNAVSKIDNLPMEMFHISFNSIISDFKGTLNTHKNKNDLNSYINIFKVK
jgi:hypothetical protein